MLRFGSFSVVLEWVLLKEVLRALVRLHSQLGVSSVGALSSVRVHLKFSRRFALLDSNSCLDLFDVPGT